jgi:hypothetical protein
MNRTSSFFLRRWTVVALLLASALGAAVPFTLRFGASGSMAIDLDPASDPEGLKPYQIGFRVGASGSFDGFDIPAPSMTPPGGGVAILYFPADDPLVGAYSQDFRPPAASQTWQMELKGMVPGSSVTLNWRLQDGSLEGNALSLVERVSGAVLVGDMVATRSYVFSDTDRSLLILYSSANHPPVARGDVAAMLESTTSVQIPFDALLANDYDPDFGDTLTVVAVGAPFVLPGSGKGTSAYGTTSIDTVARTVTYAMPAPLPAGWDGTVCFPYTIRDSNTDPTTPHEGSATVVVTVAPRVLTVPTPAQVPAHQGMPFTVAYTLVYTGSLHSLALSFTLPTTGSGPSIAFWPYGGSYADDDAATPNPSVDSGAGPDGLWGNRDDTGVVVLDFGANVPASGTKFSFVLNAPATAADAALPSVASYKITGAEPAPAEQPLPEVAVRVAYTVTFASAGNGTISPPSAAAQLLEPGRLSVEVTAVPAVGYHFLRWLRGNVEISRNNPLTLAGGSSDQTITAEFAKNTYTLTFLASGPGTLSGLTTQNVLYLDSAEPVRAVPGADAYFSRWTDGNPDNPRTITGVTGAATYTAEFLPLTPGEPDGDFDLVIQNQTNGVLRYIWDLTGHYQTTVGAHQLTLDLIHHEDGSLTGIGRLDGTTVGGQPFSVTNMPFGGSVIGKNGSLTVRGGLTGANATTTVTLRLSLTLDGLALSGVASGRVTTTAGGREPISAPCTLGLPAAMDGTYRLPTHLTLGARGMITGTSTLTLVNGTTAALLVTGRRHGSTTTLEFVGNRAADPAFGAIRFRLTVRAFSNRMAGIRTLTGNAFGQILIWHL